MPLTFCCGKSCAEDCYDYARSYEAKVISMLSQLLTQYFCAGPSLCLPALTADLLILRARVGELSKGGFHV